MGFSVVAAQTVAASFSGAFERVKSIPPPFIRPLRLFMMSYYYSSLIGWLVVFSILAIVVYSIRHHLPSALTTSLNIFPSAFSGGNEETSRSLYSRIPAYDWTASRLAGLHSTLFDIEANVRDLDDRTGLEGAGAAEVHRLMQTHGVDFDTARLMLNRSRFSKNNIDPRTGMPLDSKAVTFENLR